MISFATRHDVTSGTVVVYVHGLWLRGHEAALLRRRLARALDAQVFSFTYASVSAGVADNARSLRRYLAKIRSHTLHLVAHSLGGLVILTMFDCGDDPEPKPVASDIALPPGRIVFLGSPVRGSRSAQRLLRLPLGNLLLGRTAADVLVVPRERRWDGSRDLGVIAGDLAFGAGRLLGPMGAPNDGTVLVCETDLPGASQHLRLRVSHSGMPFSASVARQVAVFLRDGCFER